MVSNPRLAQAMRYRADYDEKTHKPGTIQDIFDGALYRSLLDSFVMMAGRQLPFYHFSDPRDIALGLSTDGVAIFRRRSITSWPLLMYNYNLPPDIRFHKENLIPLGVIPGPKKPWDMDSFIWPLAEELLQLEIGVKALDALTAQSFSLHAYLIACGGDMPALALLMRMKGHNAILPCRMCKIIAVKAPSSNTYYVPLHRCPDSSPPTYDPAKLPIRTHESFIHEATQVQFASNATTEKELATKFGIKGIPLLSCLSSLSFPASFPYDFMHLIWENLIPNLISFWTGEFKELSHAEQGYMLAPAIWRDICATSAAAGDTIPAAFGCRVPNMTNRSQITAESQSVWTLYVAPIVLCGRFPDERYYKHFLSLVRLLSLCLEFELSLEQVKEIEVGFAQWVKDYER
jgi:hypothetical protein